ncbi:MAG: DUF3592 domain-containing protein [Actinobacteria bacterium]|nr:DUF3592 domain-containing protein [Actinomycetota bacterium]
MGLLDRFLRGVNDAAEPVQRVAVLVDRRITQAADLAATGRSRGGVIVGIHRSLGGDDTESVVYSVALPVAGADPERVTVEVWSRHAHRLRLGLPVPVRTDGTAGVLDWPALCERWGVDPSDVVQRKQRKDRPDGIVDKAIDLRTSRRLAKLPRAAGTITGLDRFVLMGMRSSNWDVHLRLADGTRAKSPKDAIPVYAKWVAAPGAEVPVAVDPADPDKAAIDWIAAATAAAGVVELDDVPPPGSVAEADSGSGPAVAPAASTGPAAPPASAAPRPLASDPTLSSWVAMVQAGQMKPRAFQKAVADWQAAGMCSAEEAASALRAGAVS